MPDSWGAAVLRVGVFEQPPDIFMTPEGRVGGIHGEILAEIAQEENWELQARACNWAECLQQLKQGELDLLPSVYHSVPRESEMHFHQVPVLQTWSQIYVPRHRKVLGMADLQGLRLAVLEGSAQYDYLKTLLPAVNVHARLITVGQLAEGFERVRAGDADAMVADHFFGEMASVSYNLQPTPIIFQPADAYFAIPLSGNTEILRQIDGHLRRWQADPESVYYQIFSQWLSLSPQERRNPAFVWIVSGLAGLLALALFFTWRARREHSTARRRLHGSEDRLRTILGSVDALIYIKDAELRYVYANATLEEFLGVPAHKLMMRHNRELLSDATMVDAIEYSDRRSLAQERRVTTQERLTHAGTGREHRFVAVRLPLRNAEGKLEGLAAIFTDVTDRFAADEQAHRLTFYDTLTDLPNRRLLMSHLSQALRTAQSGETINALLILDIDGFRKINDTRGFQVGDEILREVARRLMANTREYDTVSRTSADEFMVLFTQVGAARADAARAAMRKAERLRRVLAADLLDIRGQACVLTASCGLTLLDSESASVDELIREADLAVQRARDQGGDRVVFYEQALQQEIEHRMWLERDLAQALNTAEFSMDIQPQFAQDGQITGAELLSRWQHPVHGNVAATEFIALAEQSRLINHLTETSLQLACRAICDLRAAGQDYPVSVNISPRALDSPQFMDMVQVLLTERGIPPNSLVFELTESVLMRQTESLERSLNTINQLGIALSIDDFGTGYSNLASLMRLPIYELKIDKSLVHSITDGPRHAAIVQLILDMAYRLDVRVVAEGVENAEQADFLFRHGCTAIQGYWAGRPVPLRRWLDQGQ